MLRLSDLPSPSDTDRIGRQLSAGNVEVTLRSRESGQHHTIRFAARRRNPDPTGRRWIKSDWSPGAEVFISTRGETFGKVFVGDGENHAMIYWGDNRQLIWCVRQALAAAAGQPTHEKVEIMTSSRCGICFHDLTDPISIERGIGPDCWGKITGSRAARIPELHSH